MLWKVRRARTKTSMSSLGESDRLHESQVTFEVMLQCVQPQEPLARPPSESLAQSRLVGQSRQRCAKLLPSAVNKPAARRVDGLPATTGIAHDGRRTTGERLDNT